MWGVLNISQPWEVDGVDMISLTASPSLELQRLDGKMQKRQGGFAAHIPPRHPTLRLNQGSQTPRTCELHIGAYILNRLTLCGLNHRRDVVWGP